MSETPKMEHIKKKDIKTSAKIIVVSDSLSNINEKQREKLDKSSKIAAEILRKENVEVDEFQYVRDDFEKIQNKVKNNIKKNQIIILIGGTGIAPRDVTVEAIRKLFDKELTGFGELFRYLTYKEVGTVSIMTRTTAGVINQSLIVCLPGSPNAVKLGVKLILEEHIHIFNLLAK